VNIKIYTLAEIIEQGKLLKNWDHFEEAKAHSVLGLLHTSGSTGKPKGVMQTHEGLL
jgi:long-chain acyl-CoA synthetase